ncbi:MAG: proprotein convertase P-domain-containing protein [bacterium]
MYFGSSKIKWLLALTLLTSVACGSDDNTPNADDDAVLDPVLANIDELQEGWPGNAMLANEDKADQNFPPKFTELTALQSPVKSQGSRGVCSIFASTAYIEHLYIAEGTVTNPDFSEQYLQWSSKFLEGAFPKTSGSNNQYNLQAVANHGTVVEAAWPYETSEWGPSNDEACTGEESSRPTRCFTNGEEPPQAAKDAEKFFIPTPRWQSARERSIKATMFNKKQGVPVGLTFFYQSWNHGRSELPVNSSYSRKGYVLSPNAKDRELSLAKRAGHAILLVGWDDTLEVTKMDEAGQPVLDASGNEVKEKGFFLFKNSWGKGRFGVENPEGDGYGWISYAYVEEFGSAVVSDLPVVAAPSEICGDGADNDRNGAADCDDAACADTAACQGPVSGGVETIDLDVSRNNTIPDNNPAGLSLDFTITGPGEIQALSVKVDITHPYRGDLEILLLGPNAEIATLRRPDSDSGDGIVETYVVEDFNGIPAAGEWTLNIVDTAASDEGTVNSASIELTR